MRFFDVDKLQNSAELLRQHISSTVHEASGFAI